MLILSLFFLCFLIPRIKPWCDEIVFKRIYHFRAPVTVAGRLGPSLRSPLCDQHLPYDIEENPRSYK